MTKRQLSNAPADDANQANIVEVGCETASTIKKPIINVSEQLTNQQYAEVLSISIVLYPRHDLYKSNASATS